MVFVVRKLLKFQVVDHVGRSKGDGDFATAPNEIQNFDRNADNSKSNQFLIKEEAVQLSQDTNISDLSTLQLKNKIIPLNNPVYQLLNYFETKGDLGFLPQAKPYTKVFIAQLLVKLAGNEKLSNREKRLVQRQLADILQDTNGLKIYEQTSKNSSAIIGFSAETSVRNGFGDKGTWSTSLLGEPYLAGDLGQHLTFTAGIGLAVERLTPDIFLPIVYPQ